MLQADEIVSVDPLIASTLTASGRCVLVDSADSKRVHDAAAAELKRVMQSLGARGMPTYSSQWAPWPR
jgi:hypothetical protein